MKRITLALLLCAVVVPTLASAQISLGARVGYGIPSGDAYEAPGFPAFKQSDLSKGNLALQVDAAWRFTDSLSAGLYYGYGFGSSGSKLKDLCAAPGSSCDSPSTIRYGAELAYRFLGLGPVSAWAGLAGGIQQAAFGIKNFVYNPLAPASRLKGTLRGWEAAAEGGVDLKPLGPFAFGPFVSIGVGQYTVEDVTIDALGKVASGGVDKAKTHEWITLGVRGYFDL